MIELWIFFNILISITFIGLGVYLAPRLELGSGLIRKVIRLISTAFFIASAGTRVELALYAYELPLDITSSILSLLVYMIQGLSGIAFLILARYFVGAQIVAEPSDTSVKLTLKDMEQRWKLIRDVLLFFSGLVGMAYVTLQNVRDPVLVAAFSAMMGLPVVLRGEERVNKNGATKA